MNKRAAAIVAGVLSLIVVGFTFSVCIGGGASDDWGMFRHDLARTGASTSSGPSTNQTSWVFTTSNSTRSSPAVVGGVAYFGENGGSFYALNASTGVLLWNYTLGGDVWSSPAVANGMVYVGANDHYFYALNVSNGDEIWRFLTGGGMFASPEVVGNTVYVGGTDNYVYALDASTGSEIWNFSTGGGIRGSTAIANGMLYASSEDGNLYAVNASTGSEIWSSPISPGASYTDSGPAVYNGAVYVGSRNGVIYAFSASDGAQLWNYTTGNIVESSPAAANGMIYCGSDDGSLYALDASTGALKWSFPTGAQIYSSPAVAGGTVYVGGWNGYVYALDATSGKQIWNYSTGSSVFASPTVANGALYIGAYNGNLYAFGTYVPTAGSNSSSASTPPPNSTVWVPAPPNAAAAVAFAAVATGLTSLVFTAFTDPLGGFGGKIGGRLSTIFPDNFKSWLEDFVASRKKIRVTEKNGSTLMPTAPEILAYAISIILLTFSFSYVKASSLAELAAILPVYFATSLLVGLVKKLFAISFYRSRGVWTEHVIWPFGLGLFLVTTLAFRVPFSSPTRSVSCPPKEDAQAAGTAHHRSAKFHERLGAIASAAEILIGLSFAGLFALLIAAGFPEVGGAGLAMCLIGAFFDTFPIPPMGGRGIYDHSKKLWAVLFASTLILYSSWLLFL